VQSPLRKLFYKIGISFFFTGADDYHGSKSRRLNIFPKKRITKNGLKKSAF
jgi:hypothetical protein